MHSGNVMLSDRSRMKKIYFYSILNVYKHIHSSTKLMILPVSTLITIIDLYQFYTSLLLCNQITKHDNNLITNRKSIFFFD